MGTLVFVEVIGRQGHVLDRQAVDTLPCTIGRAYDNRVILDDPFVEPHHARVEQGADGGIVLCDLGSDKPTPVDDKLGLDCMLGRTHVRLRTPHFHVPEARVDPFHGSALGRFARSRRAMFAALAVGMGTIAAEAHLDDYDTALSSEWSRVLGVFMIMLVWASIWALVGRIRSHRNAMLIHMALPAALILPLTLLGSAMQYAHSIHPMPGLLSVGQLTIATCSLGLLVATHSLVVGVPSGRRAALTGVVTSVFLAGMVVAGQTADRTEFSGHLEIDPVIRPVPPSLLSTESPEAFLARGEELRERLEQDLADP